MHSAKAYDYIIAGAGSAGCTLAGRLAEDPDVHVLLVEAGGDGKGLFVRMPAGNGFLFGNPKYDWCFESEAQPGLHGRRLYYPRGRGLGGSSLLNGMIYIRGNARDFDRWRDYGLEGWGYADVLPYFKRSEGAPHRDHTYHGHSGPLKTSLASYDGRITRGFVEAAQQAGAPLNPDFNGASQLGVGRFDTKVWRGQRQSASAAYLANPPANLDILTQTRVLKVVMDGRRARGIEVANANAVEVIHADREVILSMGAFGSPQTLMLSGVGPANHLRAHGIEVRVDLPGVGSHLQDHPNVPVRFSARDPSLSLARFQRLDKAIGLFLRYMLRNDGPGAQPFWSTTLFHALRDTRLPELQVFFTPMVVCEEGDGGGWSLANIMRVGRTVLARGKTAAPGIQLDVNLLQPRSHGTLRLASADPAAAPRIDPGYFLDPADVDDLVAGVRHMRDIARQDGLSNMLSVELTPGAHIRDDAGVADAVRNHATTGHHPVSTCRMGNDRDPEAVLDAKLKVRGVEGLRVVDASAFPDQINGNTNAGIIMLAEKAADIILGKAPLPPERLNVRP